MIARAKLDFDAAHVARALLLALRPGDRKAQQSATERAWRQPNSLACFSVRTGFDLVLKALDLPAGSEVMISAITIPDIARLVRAHGLVPVPVDIEPNTLVPTTRALEAAYSERTRAIVLTHLFGAWCRFEVAARFANERGLIVIEDSAQSYAAGRAPRLAGSHVRMFSFGTIKTETAFGGAMLEFADPALLERVRTLYDTYPVQKRRHFLMRVAKCSMLRLMAVPMLYTAFIRSAKLFGKSHDDVISRFSRGFPGENWLTLIRRQPGHALLAMLEHRFRHPNRVRLYRRITSARIVLRRLAGRVARPATHIPRHTYWLFPVLTERPAELVEALWTHGFDATRGASSLVAIEAPPERPDTTPVQARQMMERLLFVPVYPEMRARNLDRLANAVGKWKPRRAPAPPVEITAAQPAAPNR